MFAGVGLARLDVRFDLLTLFADTAGRTPPAPQVLLAVDPGVGETALVVLQAEIEGIEGVSRVAPLQGATALESLPQASRRELAARAWGQSEAALWAYWLTLERGADQRLVLSEVRGAMASLPAGHEALLVGTPVMNEALAAAARSEQLRLIPMLLGAFGLVLLLAFRGPWGVLLPLASVGLSALLVAGLLGWLQVPLGGPMLLLLPLVIILGLADTLHLLRRVALLGGGAEAVGRALEELAAPCVFTTLTTAMGFLALVATASPLLRQFGLLAASGMVIALLVGLGLPSAVILLAGVRLRPRALSWSLRLPVLSPATVAVALSLVLGVTLLGAKRVHTDIRVGRELPSSSQVLADNRRVDAALGGLYSFQLRAHADAPETPAAFAELIALQEELGAEPVVGSVISVVDAVRAVGQVRGYGPRRLTARGPGSARRLRRVLARAEQLAAEISPVPLRQQGDYLLWVRVHDRGARSWAALLDALDASQRELLTLESDGYVVLAVAAWRRIPGDLARVLGLTAGVSVLCLWGLLRSWRDALWSLVPLVLTATSLLAVLGWAQIPLRYPNLFMLSAALGLGVDAWIHLQYRRRQTDWREALGSAGTSVVWSVGLLVVGLLTLLGSELGTVREIGGVLAVAVVVNVLATLGVFVATAAQGGGAPD